MRIAQRLSILALGIAVAATIGASAQTPAGDTRPVTLVVPIAAGGGVDTIGRIFAAQLAERLKQPWVVENRPGAGGVVGLDSVAKAVPDGHTMVVIETSAVLQKWLHKNVSFDVVADFAPVAQMATTPLLLFANAGAAGGECRGADRLRQGQSRQALGRHTRHRLAASSRRRHAQRRGRHRHYACALQGHRAGAQRSARRPDSADLGDAQCRHAICRSRQDKAARRRLARPHRHFAERADA